MSITPLNVKGLLQTYLSEFDDTGVYGHIALGRSFALDMGVMISPLDQRLSGIDQQAEIANINVASDFMAQYIIRQEYRFSDVPEHDQNWPQFMNLKQGSDATASAHLGLPESMRRQAPFLPILCGPRAYGAPPLLPRPRA
jgi:phosphatidylinositol 4-kinase